MKIYRYYHNEQRTIYDVLVALRDDKFVLFCHGIDGIVEYDNIKLDKTKYGTRLLYGNGSSILWKEVHGVIYSKWKEIVLDFVSLDVETATTDQMICQIGISIVADKIIVGSKSWLIQPPSNKYDWQCVKVHNITAEKTIDALTFCQAWVEIADYLIDTPIAAHNAANFDEIALRKNLAFYHIDDSDIKPFIDTINLWGKRTALDDLCAGFEWPVGEHHDAKWDAEMCAKIYLQYLDGHEPDWELVEKHHMSKATTFSSYGSALIKNKRIGGDVLIKDLSNAAPDNNPFYDRKVVITGEFDIERKEIAQKLQQLGADVNTSISKKTNYVLVGSAPGPSKMVKIEQLRVQGYDIRMLSEDDFNRILNGMETEDLWEYMTKK